jgi:arginyl-tRNA synthetase
MLERIEATLERFRVHFDTWELQSAVETEIPEAVALLDTFEEAGAVWARTSAHGDDKDRVLVRSGGEPTYFAADAAYIRRKYARGFDHLIYVLGADHHGYVARLQALAEMLGHPRETLEVLVYQLVHLVEGGAAKKMSKRRGDVVFLDELLDAIGVDAARWYLVSRGHDQTIELDVDLAKERSNKNPVYYVQYAHARIASILRKAGEAGLAAAPSVSGSLAGAPERTLARMTARLPEVVEDAAAAQETQGVTTYATELATAFHAFYRDARVVDADEPDRSARRLALVDATRVSLANALQLLGITAPEAM